MDKKINAPVTTKSLGLSLTYFKKETNVSSQVELAAIFTVNQRYSVRVGVRSKVQSPYPRGTSTLIPLPLFLRNRTHQLKTKQIITFYSFIHQQVSRPNTKFWLCNINNNFDKLNKFNPPPQEWPISNFPWSLTRNIRSHSIKNLAFHSIFRWKLIILQILTTPLIYISLWNFGGLYFLSLGVEGLKAFHCKKKGFTWTWSSRNYIHMSPPLGRIQDFGKRGSNLWALKAQQPRGLPRKILKSGTSEMPFPRLSGWIWGKKGGSTKPIEPPPLICHSPTDSSSTPSPPPKVSLKPLDLCIPSASPWVLLSRVVFLPHIKTLCWPKCITQ